MVDLSKGKEKATLSDDDSKTRDGEKDENSDDTEANKGFECNICLDNATDPVVSYCGHLFCWPCINTWLEINPKNLCPVCKASIGKDKVVPLYGRNNPDKIDPRKKAAPPRPTPTRTQPAASSSTRTAGGPNVTFSAGLGLFPGLMTMQFGSVRTDSLFGGGNVDQLSLEDQQQFYLSRALMCFGLYIIFQLLLY